MNLQRRVNVHNLKKVVDTATADTATADTTAITMCFFLWTTTQQKHSVHIVILIVKIVTVNIYSITLTPI